MHRSRRTRGNAKAEDNDDASRKIGPPLGCPNVVLHSGNRSGAMIDSEEDIEHFYELKRLGRVSLHDQLAGLRFDRVIVGRAIESADNAGSSSQLFGRSRSSRLTLALCLAFPVLFMKLVIVEAKAAFPRDLGDRATGKT